MLYTFTNFAKSYLNMGELSAYDFWVADYTGKVGWAGEYGMWQYSGSVTAPGISTLVDLDHAYKDYPSIIRAAGLNGYGKDTEKDAGDEDCMGEEVAALFQELKQENAKLRAKIADTKKALE